MPLMLGYMKRKNNAIILFEFGQPIREEIGQEDVDMSEQNKNRNKDKGRQNNKNKNNKIGRNDAEFAEDSEFLNLENKKNKRKRG